MEPKKTKRTYTRNWNFEYEIEKPEHFYVVRSDPKVRWKLFTPWWYFFQPLCFKTRIRAMACVRLLSRRDSDREYAVFFYKKFTSVLRSYVTMDKIGDEK